MKWSWIIAGVVSGLLMQPAALRAASPYDDYYDSYNQPDDGPATPVDNDSYYSAPGQQYQADNDSYYTAPGAYGYNSSSRGDNCNTIGEMPSCGSD